MEFDVTQAVFQLYTKYIMLKKTNVFVLYNELKKTC